MSPSEARFCLAQPEGCREGFPCVALAVTRSYCLAPPRRVHGILIPSTAVPATAPPSSCQHHGERRPGFNGGEIPSGTISPLLEVRPLKPSGANSPAPAGSDKVFGDIWRCTFCVRSLVNGAPGNRTGAYFAAVFSYRSKPLDVRHGPEFFGSTRGATEHCINPKMTRERLIAASTNGPTKTVIGSRSHAIT